MPRPLTAEQDQLLQQEFLRRNDLGGNVFLLLRHTGMRIGECVDLSTDCLRSTGPDQWAIHVPLGKLKTERMVPVDAFVSEIAQRLRFFRSLDPLPPMDGSSHVQEVKSHSLFNSAITCIWSVTLSDFPLASSRTRCATPTERKCFVLA